MSAPAQDPQPPVLAREQLPSASRYELLVKIAAGGMATVYVGRLRGAEGFWRLVAIKRAHPHLLEDPSFKRMLIAEARLASKIHHPNVVSVQDVEERDGELLLIMDYVEGAALSSLLSAAISAGQPLPARIAVRVLLDTCAGLHAAHGLADEDGRSLGLVHRDVSPHNILVGLEGTARITDFGIAKCVTSGTSSTTTGVLKGKIAYMAPEYVEHGDQDARGDVFALGVVAWETLANERLFRAPTEMETMRRVSMKEAPLISTVAPSLGSAFDAVVACALEKRPDRRFASARAFADALEKAAKRADLIATPAEVGDHVRATVGDEITHRRGLVRERVPASQRMSSPESTAEHASPPSPSPSPEETTRAAPAGPPHASPESVTRSVPLVPDEPTTRPLPLVAVVSSLRAESREPLAEEMSLSTLGRSGVSSRIGVDLSDSASPAAPTPPRRRGAGVVAMTTVSLLGLGVLVLAASRSVGPGSPRSPAAPSSTAAPGDGLTPPPAAAAPAAPSAAAKALSTTTASASVASPAPRATVGRTKSTGRPPSPVPVAASPAPTAEPAPLAAPEPTVGKAPPNPYENPPPP